MASRASAIGFSLLLMSGVLSVVACSSSKDSDNANSSLGAKCASQPTFIECQSCCGVPDSYNKGREALENCLCDEACKTECASNGCSTDPNAPGATAECTACIESDKASQLCKPKAQAVCDADPACKQFQACSDTAKCGDKPDDIDGG